MSRYHWVLACLTCKMKKMARVTSCFFLISPFLFFLLLFPTCVWNAAAFSSFFPDRVDVSLECFLLPVCFLPVCVNECKWFIWVSFTCGVCYGGEWRTFAAVRICLWREHGVARMVRLRVLCVWWSCNFSVNEFLWAFNVWMRGVYKLLVQPLYICGPRVLWMQRIPTASLT